MQEKLMWLADHPDLSVVVAMGTEHWDQGLVTLTVRGDGDVTVRQVRSGSTQDWAEQLGREAVAAFGELLARHRFTADRVSATPRAPGDTPLRLALREGSDEAFARELWTGDRFVDSELEAILQATERLCHEVSDGAVGHR